MNRKDDQSKVTMTSPSVAPSTLAHLVERIHCMQDSVQALASFLAADAGFDDFGNRGVNPFVANFLS